MLKNFSNRAKALAIGVGLAIGTTAPAWATSDPYSTLVSAVNFTTVTTDVVSVAALVVAVLVAIRAIRFIYSIVKR